MEERPRLVWSSVGEMGEVGVEEEVGVKESRRPRLRYLARAVCEDEGSVSE